MDFWHSKNGKLVITAAGLLLFVIVCAVVMRSLTGETLADREEATQMQVEETAEDIADAAAEASEGNTGDESVDSAAEGDITDEPEEAASDKGEQDEVYDQEDVGEKKMKAVEGKKYVAITIDDGPDGSGCKEYLDIARENDIHLTFFVVGEKIAAHTKQLGEMIEAGCEIGNHSTTHGYLSEMSAEEIKQEIETCDKNIAFAAPDAVVRFARAPYFSYSDAVYENVGYPLIQSAVNEADSDQEEETRKRLSSLQDGDIMLMHCWNEGSKAALRALVPEMIEDGYVFVTVSELFELKEVTPENGKVYYNIP